MAQTLNYTINSNSPSGTSLSWTVSGSNLSAIYTGSTSGTVTTGAGGTANLTFNLTDNNTSSSASFTLTVSGGACGSVSDTVTVPGGVAPPPPDQTLCSTVSIPLIYCPTFDGTTGALKSVSVTKRFTTYLAASGGVAVPATVAVSGGAIVVTSTVNVEPFDIGSPGVDAEVITAFAPVLGPSDPLITGSTLVKVRGYF